MATKWEIPAFLYRCTSGRLKNYAVQDSDWKGKQSGLVCVCVHRWLFTSALFLKIQDCFFPSFMHPCYKANYQNGRLTLYFSLKLRLGPWNNLVAPPRSWLWESRKDWQKCWLPIFGSHLIFLADAEQERSPDLFAGRAALGSQVQYWSVQRALKKIKIIHPQKSWNGGGTKALLL